MIRLLRYFFTLLLLTVASVGWAEDITFSPSEFAATTQADYSLEKNGVTMTVAGSTVTSDQFRFFKNKTVTISCSAAKITKIVITCTGSGTGQYGPGNFAEMDGYSYEEKIGTWQGESNEVVFTASGGQVRATEVVVTIGEVTGKQTPTVKIGSNSIAIGETTQVTTNGPELTLTTGNASIASVTGTTVKGVAAGETTITATWAENATYLGGSKEFAITVTDPNAAGTKDNPYTVAQALDVISTLADGAKTSDKVYVKGVISSITEVSTEHGNATYLIKDNGATNELTIFRGNYLENANFTAEDQINVGDNVVVFGQLQKYVSNGVTTPEMAQGNYLISINSTTTQKEEAGLAWSASSYTATIGATNTFPTLTNPHSLPVTYTSSKPEVATIAADGTITLVAAGYTVITAASAENDSYKAGEASYTLNVNAPEQTIEGITGDIVFGELGLENSVAYTDPFTADNGQFTVTFGGGSNNGKYYDAGTGIRLYSNGTMTVQGVDGKNILKIVVTYSGSYKPTNNDVVEVGAYNAETGTWTGNSNTVTFKYKESSGQWRIQALTVTVEGTDETPAITVSPTSINKTADGGNGTITVTYKNFGTTLSPAVKFYAEDGTTTATYDWVTASIDADKNVAYTISANTGEERKAYLKVYAKDNKGKEAYSELITITQDEFKLDYATIPFEFDGGKNELPNGMTQSGLDSDYSKSPKLKFNSTGDWVILKLQEGHGDASLSYDIKGNSFSGGTFTVMVSKDGENYTELASYTELDGSILSESFFITNDVNYIKWIYTEKSAGNVALGNISVIKSVDVTIGSTGYATLYYSNKNLKIPSGVTAYTCKTNDGKKTIDTRSYTSVIPAGSAVVLKANPGTYTFQFAATGGTPAADNMLCGTDKVAAPVAPGDGEYTFYKLADGENGLRFYKVESGFKNGAHKAYLAVPASVAADSYSFELPDGIEDITVNPALEGATVYTLSGVRMNTNKLPAGIYIVNGKKVVIK